MIVPVMGKTTSRSCLADALFTPVQQRVLGLLFGQPDRRFQSAELIRLARGGVGAVHRQLTRLEAVGLVVATRIGNQKHYQAQRESPIFAELHGLISKTVGLAEPLRTALDAIAGCIRAAFIFGSVAKGTESARSDIDLMVISDELHYADLFAALEGAERLLARPINPTVMSLDDWRAKRERADTFAARVALQPKLFVIGSGKELA
jgi:predicted nucleotidyltransferase